jgi:transcription antitermination factor NusA-like protein
MKIDVEIVFDNQARKRKLEFDPTTFDFDWGQFKRKAGRRGKIYGAPLAGAGAMALTGWAVANWWNPSGWLAAVAAVGTVAVGYAASKLTEKVSVNLVESGDKTIKKERTKLRASLRKRIEDEYLSLRKDNLAWAEQVINKAEATLTDSIKIAIDRASELRSVGRQMVRDLVRLRSQVAVAQLKSLLPLSYPPQIVDAVEVLRVARRVGYRTKILIKSRSGKPVGGLVVGGNGANLRLLADNLGAEPIDIVEQEAGGLGIREVLSSIRPARVAPERVLIMQDRRLHRIKVKLTLDPQNIRLFRGPYQWNMQLCRELLNCDFEVSEEEEYHEESADRDRVPTAS